MAVERMLRFRTVGALAPAEQQRLEAAIHQHRTVGPRRTIVRQGEPLEESTLLVDGFMARCIDDRAGYRQVVAVHVPGDFVDLHAYPLKHLDHDVITLTPVEIATVPHTELDLIQKEWPDLARMLWAATMLDAAIHRQWVFRQGRLDATGRIAHFLCEMNARMFAIGLSDGVNFSLPLTQADIAEACGLTAIHVNRVLRELRTAGLCTLRSGRATLHRGADLVAIGQFDPAYLYLDALVVGRLKALGVA